MAAHIVGQADRKESRMSRSSAPRRALRIASGVPPFQLGFPAFAVRSSKVQ